MQSYSMTVFLAKDKLGTIYAAQSGTEVYYEFHTI